VYTIAQREERHHDPVEEAQPDAKRQRRLEVEEGGHPVSRQSVDPVEARIREAEDIGREVDLRPAEVRVALHVGEHRDAEHDAKDSERGVGDGRPQPPQSTIHCVLELPWKQQPAKELFPAYSLGTA
jgi:hypothetical protein